MGMAASQARLLSITARLSDNEQTAQAVSYAKERLADRSEQITDEYNNALAATKLQIMTGYADGAASFSDVSFSSLACSQVIDLGRQYIVTDPKGKVLVEKQVAKAFINSAGSLDLFLGNVLGGLKNGSGYSISDVNPTLKATDTLQTEEHNEIIEKIHEAWDKYFVSIGKTDYYLSNNGTTGIHPWEFNYHNNPDNIGQTTPPPPPYNSGIGNGYAVIEFNGGPEEILNYEGSNQEQLNLYNYAKAITESFYSHDEPTATYPTLAHDFSTIKTNFDPGNRAEISYYENLFYAMLSSGFYSYTGTLADVLADPEHWIYESGGVGGTSPISDAHTFEQYLKDGKLIVNCFSKIKNRFEKVSISEDTCFQEVQDKTKIAQAEAKYTNDLKQLERLDSRYDLQLKRLDTEHNTLQTEYESVKKVISNNVQNSFKTFG